MFADIVPDVNKNYKKKRKSSKLRKWHSQPEVKTKVRFVSITMVTLS